MEPKIKKYRFKEVKDLAPDLGIQQDARAGDKSFWDRSGIMSDMLTIGGYAPTEGPLVAFQDELDGSIPHSSRTFADGNLRALAIVDICEAVEKGKAPSEALDWEVPVLLYPPGVDQETRERIRNRARDTTQTKTRHDYNVWALRLAKKNPTMGDTDLCRLIGPRPIRSQWPDAVREESTFLDEKGVERFKPDLPLDAKDAPAMLVNKQGPIQEVTRVRSLPEFAQQYFLLPPTERLHKSFNSSRDWAQKWAIDRRSPFGPKIESVGSLKELLDAYPDSKLGAEIAKHVHVGKVERKSARGEGSGAMTAAERQREITSMAQGGSDGHKLLAHYLRYVGRESGYTSADAKEFFEGIAEQVKLSKEGQSLLSTFENSIAELRAQAVAAATKAEQEMAARKAKEEAAAIKKAKKGA